MYELGIRGPKTHHCPPLPHKRFNEWFAPEIKGRNVMKKNKLIHTQMWIILFQKKLSKTEKSIIFYISHL